MATAGAIIVGAGRAERMGGVDKIFAKLNDSPVLAYSVEAFSACQDIQFIVLVLHEQRQQQGARLAHDRQWTKVQAVVPGGNRRQDSVLAGLEALPPCDYVLVHDAARPLVTGELIRRGLAEAASSGAAIAAVPVTDTMKRVGPDGTVTTTLPRENLWSAQTPQVVRRAILQASFDYVGRLGAIVTDEAAMVELAGFPVTVFTGSHRNLKITTATDLTIAAALLAKPS